MKLVEQFIDGIDIIEVDEGGYGHYPFTLQAFDEEETLTMCSLALGGEVGVCYRIFSDHTKEKGAELVMMSVDFPKGLDMDNDFVAVFSWDKGTIGLVALPYNNETGERFERISGGCELLERIKEEFTGFISAQMA